MTLLVRARKTTSKDASNEKELRLIVSFVSCVFVVVESSY